MAFENRKAARAAVLVAGVLFLGSVPSASTARGAEDEVGVLKRQIEELSRRNAEQRKLIDSLLEKVERIERSAREPARSEGASAATGAVPGPPRAVAASAPASSDAAALAAALEAAGASQAPARPAQPGAAAAPLGGSAPFGLPSARIGGANLRLVDVSMDVVAAAGTSTATDDEIRGLQGGGHDPRRRGFTLQQAELSLSGAVDPYLAGESHIVFFEGGVELEEAFLTTLQLPFNLQLEAGYFLTEFGLVNPVHAHAWDWIDQPLVVTRMFGGDGNRGVGFRLGWLAPLPWFSELHAGVQNADGDFAPSFHADRGVGGRPAVDRDVRSLDDLSYLVRWNNSWTLGGDWVWQLGVSGMYGPNSTGRAADTWIYGADLKLLWRSPSNFRGYPFFLLQAEAMKRDYTADSFLAGSEVDPDDGDGHGHNHGHAAAVADEDDHADEGTEFPNDLPGGILRDAGFYAQALYGFRWGWSTGLRYEFAGGSGKSVMDGDLVSRRFDSLRDDRHRFSPLLVWRPTEFSRFRLQYNYDHADHLQGKDAHSFWLGAEVLYGAHPAHRY